MDSVKQALIWCGIGAATSPIWGTVVWVIWEGSIRPRLIPDGEIESLAAAMLRLYGEKAAEVAFMEEDWAWRYSRPFQQGKWRRVRKRMECCEAFAKK